VFGPPALRIDRLFPHKKQPGMQKKSNVVGY
jgi:hypothetical protein